jgi:hypothetical protein
VQAEFTRPPDKEITLSIPALSREKKIGKPNITATSIASLSGSFISISY